MQKIISPMAYELLLMLQDLRLSLPDIVTSAMLLLSSPVMHVAIPIALASIFLWCFDRRQGEWMAMNVICGFFFGHLLKDMIKIPRPWVADDRIIPCEKALDTASGYSTPSGHSVDSVTSYGTLMLILKNRWVTLSLAILILAIMFSRMFLGVHTIWDLMTGAILAIAIITINDIMMRYSFSSDGNYLRASVLYILVFITAMMIWMLMYDDNSTLLKYTGLMAGTLIARPVGHFYIHYDGRNKSVVQNIAAIAIGWIFLGALFVIPYILLDKTIGMVIGGFLAALGLFIFVPLILRKMDKYEVIREGQ